MNHAMIVALLTEGVDRNKSTAEIIAYNKQSPSSRRAWIEIVNGLGGLNPVGTVALLTEGVDRNDCGQAGYH